MRTLWKGSLRAGRTTVARQLYLLTPETAMDTVHDTTPEATPAQPLRDVLRLDQEQLQGHLDRVVRDSVEQTLNALLDAEADQLCGAGRYQRSPDRVDTRAGSYTRQLHTKAGEVTLKVPRLRYLPFETQIIER